MTTVTVGTNVTCRGAFAFSYCPSLTGVYFEGNAPCILQEGSTFDNAEQATVYYLPETLGWGVDYDGRPTELWLPLVLTRNASFGVRTNLFGFDMGWASGRTVVVEAAVTLATPNWFAVGTNTLVKGLSYFGDPDWINHPARFYRLRSP